MNRLPFLPKEKDWLRVAEIVDEEQRSRRMTERIIEKVKRVLRFYLPNEKKYEIAIGKYDEELNQKNRSIAIGQGKTADMRGKQDDDK